MMKPFCDKCGKEIDPSAKKAGHINYVKTNLEGKLVAEELDLCGDDLDLVLKAIGK
jgi:hypothetical protein